MCVVKVSLCTTLYGCPWITSVENTERNAHSRRGVVMLQHVFFLITFLDLKSVKKSLLQGPDFEGESKRGEETRVCLVRSGGVLVASRRAGKVHPYNATTTSLRTNSLDYTVRSCHETTRAESPLQRHGLRPKALCVFSKTKLEKLTTKKKTPRRCPRLGAV